MELFARLEVDEKSDIEGEEAEQDEENALLPALDWTNAQRRRFACSTPRFL